jgi:hypothetical protein
MLAREKKRAAWSLAIGAFCASAILGWEYRKARIADSRLPALVEQCRVSHARFKGPIPGTVPIPPNATIDMRDVGGKLFMPGEVCEPDALADTASYDLTPVQQQIADFAQDAQNRNAWPLAIAAFAVFCLPLIWYFLLDRARELSAAISGRDRSP